MLSINGFLQGKNYQDETISATDLAKLFPDTLGFLTPVTNAVEFRVSATRSKVHRGQEIFPTEIQIVPFFTASYQGETFTLRYYESVRGPRDDRKYSPFRISLNLIGGRYRESKEGAQRNIERIAFLALCPSCGTSPLATKPGRVRFNLYDEVGEAKKTITEVRRTSEVVMSVLNGEVDANTLLNVAAGLGLNTQQPLAVIQSSMISMAQSNAAGFAEKFTSENVRVAGLAQRLLQNNVILRSNVSGQVKYAINVNAAAAIGQPGYVLPLDPKPSDELAKAQLVQHLLFNSEDKELLELMLSVQTGQKPAPKAAKPKAAVAATTLSFDEPEEGEPEMAEAVAAGDDDEPAIKPKRSRRKKNS